MTHDRITGVVGLAGDVGSCGRALVMTRPKWAGDAPQCTKQVRGVVHHSTTSAVLLRSKEALEGKYQDCRGKHGGLQDHTGLKLCARGQRKS